MANRAKEDEKNEKIIRGLLKVPANRRCVNCNNLGPQYVCTNFWTFICTTCSGIHREFTHRVKSISMAKFSSEEVLALQEGGNERAREIYLKDWDPQCHSFPDSRNIDRLRDFIKHVYVYRKYSGESAGDRPERMKGDRNSYNENRSLESDRGPSRSSPYDDHHNPSYVGRNDRYNYGQRGPGYNQGFKRSPVRFEVVDDRFKDDKIGNGSEIRRLEDRRFLIAQQPRGRSPDHRKSVNKLSLPVVRPVKDTLGDNVPQVQIADTPKSNGTSIPDDSTQMKGALSSSSISSTDANAVQLKGSSSESLIDFDVDPLPPVAATPEPSVPKQTTSATDNDSNWAASDISGQQKIPQVAPNANTLVSALAQLSVLQPEPAGNTANLSVRGIGSSPKASGGGNLPTVQQQPSVFQSIDNIPSNHPSNAHVVGVPNDQVKAQMSSRTSFGQGSFTVPSVDRIGHPPQIATKPPQEIIAEVPSQSPSAESKPSGRKELPVGLFTSLYPTAPVSAPGWQRGPYPGMRYNMQYHTGVATSTFTQAPKSVNPFDHTGDPAPVFPSATPMQVALPNMAAPATLLQTSRYGGPSAHWIPSQQLPYASSVSPSPFMMHQVPNNMPHQLARTIISVGNQGNEGSGDNGAAFDTSGINQNAVFSYPKPSTPNSSGSLGGNPFG